MSLVEKKRNLKSRGRQYLAVSRSCSCRNPTHNCDVGVIFDRRPQLLLIFLRNPTTSPPPSTRAAVGQLTAGGRFSRTIVNRKPQAFTSVLLACHSQLSTRRSRFHRFLIFALGILPSILNMGGNLMLLALQQRLCLSK